MEYKYEVAFSLTEENKEIARQINNLIKNKFDTYVYFENKTETAAQDGLDIFYNIFYQEARIIVILYSEKWGKTDWTSKEELAIQNRIVKNGWDFLIIVKLNKKLNTPDWYPNSQIWVDFEEYGVKGVAGVIENKVRVLGGKIKVESVIDKAKRIAEENNNLRKIKEILDKEYEGIKRANDEVLNLFKLCKERIKSLSEEAKDLYFEIKKEESNYIQIKAQLFVLHIYWSPRSINFLDGSHLDIKLMKQEIENHRYEEYYNKVISVSYVFDINPSWIPGWRKNNYKGKFFTSEQLLDFWLDNILERIK